MNVVKTRAVSPDPVTDDDARSALGRFHFALLGCLSRTPASALVSIIERSGTGSNAALAAVIPMTLPAIRSDFLFLVARLATASAAVCAPLNHRSGETSSSNDLKKADTRVQVESYDRTLSRIAKLPKTSRQKSFTAPSDTKVSAIPSSNCFDPTLLAQSRVCRTRANRIGRQFLWRGIRHGAAGNATRITSAGRSTLSS
jgi:hypothetical protein